MTMQPQPLPPPTVLSAVFVNPESAEQAIGALEDRGIGGKRISVLTAQNETTSAPPTYGTPHPAPYMDKDGFLEVQTEDLNTPTDMNAASDARLGGTTEDPIEAEGKHGLTTTTPADAAKGAAEGSMVGLGLGLLAGAAALMVPGVGLVLAAGPLWAALGGVLGATAAGAAAGGVTGYLKDMGVGEENATQIADAVHAGSLLVSVDMAGASDRAAEVEGILRKYGATTVTPH